MPAMVQTGKDAAQSLMGNLPWMWWNLMLALIPVALATVLFRWRPARRPPAWWVGAIAFVAFLPNAPYVMTDVIHLFYDVRTLDSDAALSLAVVPQYALFIGAGVVAYTYCLVHVEAEFGRRVVPALHALCAVGIYIGRAARLNSWDLVAQPAAVAETVLGMLMPRNLLVVAIVFCVLFLTHDVARRLWLARSVLLRGAPR